MRAKTGRFIPSPTCLPPVSAGEETSPLRFAGLGIGVIRLGFGIIPSFLLASLKAVKFIVEFVIPKRYESEHNPLPESLASNSL
jgi:hypothetical protein